MTTDHELMAAFGALGLAMFLFMFWQISGIQLKLKNLGSRIMSGSLFFFICLMQLPMHWGKLQGMPTWAMVLFLVGDGFGMAGGLLYLRSGLGDPQANSNQKGNG
jgi:hypothetical protein